jgi:hypothetical protein
LTLFEGDVALEGRAYRIAAPKGHGRLMLALAGDATCEDLATGRTYRFFLGQRRVVVGVRDKEDDRWATRRVLLSCSPLP